MAADPWVKLWWSWFSSRSHTELSFDALHLGGWLMSIAKASPEPPWMLNLDGSAKTLYQLARGARMEGSRETITARMKSALDELIGAQTLVVRNGDGAFGFTEPGWAKYQLSEAYFRVKRHRAKTRNADSNATETGRHQRSEIRDQKTEEDSARGSAPSDPREAATLSAWNEHCGGILPRAVALTDVGRRHFASRLSDFPDLAFWTDAFPNAVKKASGFLATKKGGAATLEWFLADGERVVKLMSGAFDPHTSSSSKKSSPASDAPGGSVIIRRAQAEAEAARAREQNAADEEVQRLRKLAHERMELEEQQRKEQR